MVAQSYPSWISEQDLSKAIRHVYEKYKKALEGQNLRSFNKNVIDPFTLLFDVTLTEKDIEDWLQEESARQLQKTLSNAVGDFHQIVLGSCKGWKNLGTGNETGLDLKKEDNTVFAEIKNKYNTMNSNSSQTVFNKLKTILTIYPSATAYLVQVIKKPGPSYDLCWGYKGNNNQRIRIISGDKFYEKVTGQPTALKQLYSILSKTISDFLKQEGVKLELIEGKLIEQIGLQMNKNNLSSQEIIDYFFEAVYPSSSTNAMGQQLMLQASNELEEEMQETDEEIEDEDIK